MHQRVICLLYNYLNPDFEPNFSDEESCEQQTSREIIISTCLELICFICRIKVSYACRMFIPFTVTEQSGQSKNISLPELLVQILSDESLSSSTFFCLIY